MKTKYYGQDKEIDDVVEHYIRNEVFACQSYLVDALLKAETSADDVLDDFQFENIEHIYPDADSMDYKECENYCQDHGLDCNELEDQDIDTIRDFIQDNAEPVEIFEWWLVSPWLAEELRALDEPILEVYKGSGAMWWGRTCTGQAIALDPTFYDIYARNH